jgi:hypothetical protein
MSRSVEYNFVRLKQTLVNALKLARLTSSFVDRHRSNTSPIMWLGLSDGPLTNYLHILILARSLVRTLSKKVTLSSKV